MECHPSQTPSAGSPRRSLPRRRRRDLILLGFVLLTSFVVGGRFIALKRGGWRPSPLGGDLYDFARGAGWSALDLDGTRATATPSRLWPSALRGDLLWWTFPATFAEGFTPTELLVDGRPCPPGDGSQPGTCRVALQQVTFVARPGDPAPRSLTFTGPPEALRRETALRGLDADDPPPIAYLHPDRSHGRVLAGHSAGAIITLLTPPPSGSELVFRPVLLLSPIFDGSPPQAFEVTGRALGLEAPPAAVLWQGPPIGPSDAPVRVPLGSMIETTRGLRLTFRVPSVHRGQLGPLSAWSDLAVVPAAAP